MRTRLLALIFTLCAVPAFAQVQPSSFGQLGGVTPPIFGSPSSGLTGSGQLTNACLTWPAGTLTCELAVNEISQFNGTSAQRLNVFNTRSSSTNYEAFSIDWQTVANAALIGTRTAATGTNRRLQIGAQDSSAADNYGWIIMRSPSNNTLFEVGAGTSTGTGGNVAVAGDKVSLANFTSTVTSGTVNTVAIKPTYNQAAATTANTDLLIQRTETSVGSGAQYAIQTQRGSTNQFTVTAGSSGKGLQIATAQAAVPTITTNGATSPACVGSDTFMTCTEGTSPPAAATFTVTFNGTWAAAPSCIAVRGTTGASPLVQNVVTTTTTVQVNLSANLVASEKFHIHCGGIQ